MISPSLYATRNTEPFYSAGSEKEYSWATEEQAQYDQFRQEFGPGWYYYEYRELVTTINRLGYRSTTVVPPDTGDYFVHLGCSNTFGQYLHESDRASNLVEQATSTPVINLGILGSGANMIAQNMQKLWFSNYPKPRAIIVQWPSIHRLTFPNNKGVTLANISRIDKSQFKYFADGLIQEGVYENQAYHAFCIINSLGVPVINFALEDYIAEFYDIPSLESISQDRARDNLHCGPLTNKEIYKHIIKELNTV